MQEKNVPNRIELVARWKRLGLNAHKIAVALGVDWRAVRNVELATATGRKPRVATLRSIDAYVTELENEGPRDHSAS